MYRNQFSPPVFPYSWSSDWGEDQYGLWQSFTYKSVRHAFRWIPPGKFMMGSPSGEAGDMTCEDPVGGELGRTEYEARYSVTVTQGFWLGETTVTQALWSTIMDISNPSYFKGENHPMEQVSWDDTQIFITKLNQLHPELKVRLPLESEWEYACRAGTQTPFNFDDTLSLDKVNYRGIWEWKGENEWGEQARKQTVGVKSYPCNAWGLYEMHGNVWEWCQDMWVENLMHKSPVLHQEMSDQAGEIRRVIRGGSWFSNGAYTRSATRHKFVQHAQSNYLGFRLVMQQ